MPDSNQKTPAQVTYWQYINTDTLLNLQHPVTTAHDEFQFIVVHQTFELWFRLVIYEISAAIDALRTGDLPHAAALLRRAACIMLSAEKGFDPLMTMTPQGYLQFRDALAPASGFQSVQFRILEILMGIKRLPPSDTVPRQHFYWETALQSGSTFTAFVQKYYDELSALADKYAGDNLRDFMLRITEEATGETGDQAYISLLQQPDAFPHHALLADAARELQEGVKLFRTGHHRVTRFSIGDAATGTSNAHAPTQQSCSAYLSGVIENRSVIFPELQNALDALH